MPQLWIPLIALLIVAFAVVAIYVSRETRAETRRTGKHPKGHYMSQGVGAGIAIGAGIGVAMGNIAIGIPIGLAIGAGIGASREKQHAQELRPMTEKEKTMKRWGVLLTFGLLTVAALIAVGLFFFQFAVAGDTMRFFVLAATVFLLGGCGVAVSPDEESATDAADSIQPYTLDYALAQPIFGEYYACGEHGEGELPYIGDALGADCTIQKLEEIDGRTFSRMYDGDGNANEDWYGWGRDVLSPCAGEVVKVTINATTNVPGVLGEPPATFVVVKREDGVHFLLAHLDDLTVEIGDRVTAGQKLGVVGNNGYGRNPHVHMGAWHGELPLQIRFDLSASSEG